MTDANVVWVNFPELHILRGHIRRLIEGKINTRVPTVLIHGPPGSGKSCLVQRAAELEDIGVVCGNAWDFVLGSDAGIGERVVSKWFNGSGKQYVLLLDQIECIFPAKSTNVDELCCAFVAEIMEKRASCIVVGISHSPHLIDPSVLNIFEDSVLLDFPSPKLRLELFEAYCSHFAFDPHCPNLKGISDQCTGFSPADVAESVKRAFKARSKDSKDDMDISDAVASVRSTVSAAARLGVGISTLRWGDVGGHNEVKDKLKELVLWQQQHVDMYKRMSLRPLSGLLLFGPPGTGKTILAKAAAGESSCHFVECRIPDIIRSEVGGSEKAIADVFRRARSFAPCIVFIDELQALFGARGRVDVSAAGAGKMITQLMLEMDVSCTVDGGVVVIGATNRPWDIDAALLRPGRLERALYVGPPDEDERLGVLNVLKKSIKLSPAVDLSAVAAHTSGYSGADLRNLVLKAGRETVMRGGLSIEGCDISVALESVSPSVTYFMVEEYKRWNPGANLLDL